MTFKTTLQSKRTLAVVGLVWLPLLMNKCVSQVDSKSKPPSYQFMITMDDRESKKVIKKIAKLEKGLQTATQVDHSLVIKTVMNLKGKDAIVEIIADKKFVYSDLMKLVELAQESGFASIRITALDGLQWEVFDKVRYDQVRFKKPTVLTVMADLCPGCRRLRDTHWKSKKILEQLAARNVALFFGVGSQDEKIKEFVQTEFRQELPVVIILNSKMGDVPKVLPKIPSEEAVLKALEEKLPIKKFGRQVKQ